MLALPTPPSDTVLLAIIASFTTLIGQVITMISGRRRHKKDSVKREELVNKVDSHSKDLKEQLEVNTKLTQAATNKASQAYSEANNFNARLYQVETELKEDVIAELIRLSHNIHHIANALAPLVGSIELEKKIAAHKEGC